MRLTRPLMSVGLMLALLAGSPVQADSKNYSKPTTHSDPDRRSLPPQTQDGFVKPPPQSNSPPPFAREQQGGYTKPPSGIVQAAPGNGGYSKPGLAGSPQARTAADTVIAKGQSKVALSQFDADQRRFRAPPVSAPPNPQAARQSPAWQRYGRRWNSADDYYAARARAEQRLQPQVQLYYRSPPQWVVQGPPSYGQYAASFLGGALIGGAGTALYDNWAYAHHSDPDYQRWHADMERQAEDNIELHEKLAMLDAQVAKLEADKAPVVESDEIDPALVIAPQIVMLATAKTGMNWWIWGPLILVLCAIGFILLCVGISRRRQRLA